MPQPFDPRTLDWSRHRLSDEETEVGDGLFLPQAAQMIGAAVLERWTGQETILIGQPLPPAHEFPDPDFAFDETMKPIPEVHAAFGPIVRRVRPPSSWAAQTLEREDHAAWLLSHVPDPETGGVIPEGALRSRRGEDADDPISYDNWQDAYLDAVVDDWFRRSWAPKALSIVAKALGDMASGLPRDGGSALEIVARPFPGGACVPLDPVVWNTGHETRMRRLASCAIAIDQPFDPAAEPDHFLFVATDGLEETVRRYAEENFVPTFADDDPWLIAQTTREARPQWPDLEARIEAFLREKLREPENRAWRGPQMMAAVQTAFGSTTLDGLVEKIRKKLRLEEAFSFLTIGGRPKSRTRLTVVGD